MNTWTIYEIITSEKIHGVKMRGRIRKFAIEQNIELLTENATDGENIVRFALLNKMHLSTIRIFLEKLLTSVEVKLVMENITNPVLSKLKVNITERYI